MACYVTIPFGIGTDATILTGNSRVKRHDDMKIQKAATRARAEERKPESRGARERIFETARELFYKQGIRAVGVETIAAEAGTTKMSLYRHFPSKDELTAECLRAARQDFAQWWDEITAPHAGNPRKQLEAIFKAFQEKGTDEDDCRGCALANAAVELPDPKHPARKVVIEHKTELRRRLQQLCKEMGARHWEKLGDCLMLLMEGAHSSRIVFGADGPAQVVWKAANSLIEAERAIS